MKFQLTEDERRALTFALDSLNEDVDTLPHETATWQDRAWAVKQLSGLLERAPRAWNEPA